MKIELPPGYTRSHGSLEALPAAYDCLQNATIAAIGMRDLAYDTIAEMLQMPGMEGLDRDFVVIHDKTGAVVATEMLMYEPPYVTVSAMGGVRDGHTGLGIGTALIGWAEGRAAELAERANPEHAVTLSLHVYDQFAPAADLVVGMGFEVSRYAFTMAITFDEPPAVPGLPAGIELRPLRPEIDDRAMALATDEAFQDHYGHVPKDEKTIIDNFTHWAYSDDNDLSLWWIAWDGDEIAGTLWVWPEGDLDPERAYVGALGVRRPWRGRGLARAMLLHSFKQVYDRGRPGVELEVDADSLTGALRLYESVGMHVANRIGDATKTIRPGIDVRRITLDQ